ncbi:MAG: hypothetical protein ACQESR_10745 [Planctomycetota bacterium]
MESCPTQAVLPLVGLAAKKVIRDRYNLRETVTVRSLNPEFGSRSARRRDVCCPPVSNG